MSPVSYREIIVGQLLEIELDVNIAWRPVAPVQLLYRLARHTGNDDGHSGCYTERTASMGAIFRKNGTL